MQLDLIDPREMATITQTMHDDAHLRSAIRFMRGEAFRADLGWPHVEHLVEVAGRPAWAVDDGDLRYVVIGALIFRPVEFEILDERIRTAAMSVFGKLNWNAAHPGMVA